MRLVLALMLVRALWSIEALLFNPFRFVNHEEAYNATVGWLVWHGGLWEALLRLQYRAFCGGCTVVSAMAAPTLGLLGDHFLVWKGLAVVWGMATVGMAAVAGTRLWGRSAGLALALLLALPPGGLGELSLMLWGNHQETTLLLMISLALLPRGGASLGVVLGLSVWFCRTSAYFVAVLLPLALWQQPGRGRLLGGLAAGLAPLLLPAGAGVHGQISMQPGDHLLPEGLPGAWKRLRLLLDPAALAPRLFLVQEMTVGAAMMLCNAAVSAVILVRRRCALPLLLAAVFVVAFSVTGFHVPLPGRILPVVNARYHAPWMVLLLLLPAAAVAGRRSLLLLVIPVSVGLLGRSLRPAGPGYVPWQAPATDRWQFLASGAVRLSGAELRDGDGEYMALLKRYRTDTLHEEEAAALRALRGQAPGHDFGAGFQLAARCQRPDPAAFCRCVQAAEPGDVVLKGVGAATADPWRNSRDVEMIAACLGPAFSEGLAHPMAGISRAVTFSVAPP